MESKCLDYWGGLISGTMKHTLGWSEIGGVLKSLQLAVRNLTPLHRCIMCASNKKVELQCPTWHPIEERILQEFLQPSNY